MKQEYNQRSLYRGFRSLIIVGAEREEHIVFRMIPSASILGTITNSEGALLRGVTVRAIHVYGEGTGRKMGRLVSAVTNSAGQYSMDGLEGGHWLLVAGGGPVARPNVQATDPVSDIYPATLYPGVTDKAEAKTIEVKPGELIPDADFSLTAGPESEVELHVAGASPTNPLIVGLGWKGFDERVVDLGALGLAVGERTVLNRVPFGDYVLALSDRTGRLLSVTDVKVKEAKMKVTAQPAAARVYATVEMQGLPQGKTAVGTISLVHSSYRLAANQGFLGTGRTDFGNILAGRHSVSVVADGKTTYAIISVKVNGFLVENDAIDVPTSGELQLEVVAAPGTLVDGLVVRDGKTVAGTTAVLIPRQHVGNLSEYRLDQSDSDGTFHWTGVAPGEYWMVAGDDIEAIDLADADFRNKLTRGAQSITVSAKAEAAARQTVHLEYKPQ